MDNSASQKVSVQVCGDLLLDFNLLRHTKEPAPFHSDGLERVGLRITHGGAWYLADVLQAAYSSQECEILSPKRPELQAEILTEKKLSRAYQTWERIHDPFSKEKEGWVWRIRELMGCTVSDNPYPNIVESKSIPTALVIDDLGLGFANNMEVWPDSLRRSGPVSQVVVKHSGLLKDSDLRRMLISPAWAANVTAIVPARALRHRGASLIQGLSWDRALDDLDRELVEGVSASDLGRFQRVIVTFQDEAAALFVQKQSGFGLTFDRMIFAPDAQEGAWKETRAGSVFGSLSLLTSAVVRHLVAPASYPLNLALARGLKSGMVNYAHGGGAKEAFKTEVLPEPVREVLLPPTNNLNMLEPIDDFVVTWAATNSKTPFGFVSRGVSPDFSNTRGDLLRDAAGETRSAMLSTALDVVLRGPNEALRYAPKARYGYFVTADREEVESINAIRNLVLAYKDRHSELRPLSIAVFGAPGCGKSFAVKQMISTLFPKDQQEKPLVFNLSEFRGEDDLTEAFHQIRDLSQRGRLPLVFWDEFDSKLGSQKLGWLKDFLAPMQDSEYRAHGHVHPLGRAIFIFAGGTCKTFDEFTQKANEDDYNDCKITDFLSRLRGYINIKGPNPREIKQPEKDPAHVIRRALLLHSAIKEKCPHAMTRGAISADVIMALLQVGEYRHGARSIEALVAMCQTAHGASFTAAVLPPPDLIGLHIADENFSDILSKTTLDVAVIEHLADIRHKAWSEERKSQKWTLAADGIRDDINKKHPRLMDHSKLSEAWKEDNRRPARLTHDYLLRLGYTIRRMNQYVPNAEAITDFPEDDLKQLMEHEHTVWMCAQSLKGFERGTTQSYLRQHEDLVPISELSKLEYRLDKAIIKSLPKALSEKGLEIVKIGITSDNR